MYEPFKFAASAKEESFTDPNTALLHAAEIAVESNVAAIGEIVVDSEGNINLGTDRRKITKLGFESFGRVLGMTNDFMRRIPEDLLLHNIERLSRENASDEVAILTRSNGEIASIVRTPYKEIPYTDVLGRFIDKGMRSVSMSEVLMKALFIHETQKVPELDDALNSFFVHETLTTSSLKLSPLQVTSGLYRTQCENSFIMSILGHLRANYDKDPEKRLNNFADAFECYDFDLRDMVFNRFASSMNGQLKEFQVKHIWEKYSAITSKSEADILFGFDEESRNALLATARQYIADTKKAQSSGAHLPFAETTLFKAMDVANVITSAAHTKLTDMDSLKAEVLGGDILTWMLFKNQPE